MSAELAPLRILAQAMGVHTDFVDGRLRPVEVAPETLVRVCAALGAEIAGLSDAPSALRALETAKGERSTPPVVVAWDGVLGPVDVKGGDRVTAEVRCEDGGTVPVTCEAGALRTEDPLPTGYHQLTAEAAGQIESCTVISAPVRAWTRPDSGNSWGVGAHLAALRSRRSRALGDLADLETLCRWTASHGGDLVTVLPLLPTFNRPPPEPSPYSPVSRLFWSELILDLGDAHRAVDGVDSLDVAAADAEVRAALAAMPSPDPATLDDELRRYAQFRGAQARLGRDWRSWPEAARGGALEPEHIDPEEERFHRVAQSLVRGQLGRLLDRLEPSGLRLGLDLAVGVHPHGYDPWSRQHLFVEGMSVGAPPDKGFPSGQDWGFSPVLPHASRLEGHRYLAASIAHQASLAGVLRFDHIMALTRLYWIPNGHTLDQGTYVSYPVEELFAILTLESHRNACEVIGENLGTVPEEIDEALPRHGIAGMYFAEFAMSEAEPEPPTEHEVALVGSHDTPTFSGWIAQHDIDERIRCGLLEADAAPEERQARVAAAELLAELLGGTLDDERTLLGLLLEWLGSSPSPLAIPWLEDLWLEPHQVNLPGTGSWERPNWQRVMSRPLDEALADPEVVALLRRLDQARRNRPAESRP